MDGCVFVWRRPSGLYELLVWRTLCLGCCALCLGGSHDTPGRNRPLRLKYIWAALGLDALWHTTHLDEHSAYNAVSVAVEKIVQFACDIVNFVSSVHSDLIKMTTTAVILVGECIEECKKKTKKCGNSHTAGLKMCNNELVHLYSPQNLLVIAKSAFFQSHKATKDAREYLKVWFVIHTCIIQLYTGLFAFVLKMQISQSKS